MTYTNGAVIAVKPQAFRQFQYPIPPLHLQPDAHKAVLGAWERMETPLTIAA